MKDLNTIRNKVQSLYNNEKNRKRIKRIKIIEFIHPLMREPSISIFDFSQLPPKKKITKKEKSDTKKENDDDEPFIILPYERRSKKCRKILQLSK